MSKGIVHCFDCDQICCRTTVVEVEAPRSFRDYSDLMFYLYHFDTEIVVAKNGRKTEWYVEFMSPCRFIDENGRCTIYEKRPLVCREYEMDACERNLADRFAYIRTPEQFVEFLESTGRTRFLDKLVKTHMPKGGFPPPSPRSAKRVHLDRRK